MILPLVLIAQLGVVRFETRVAPETVYVGQQVSYDAITLVDDVARQRLRANPEFTPADVSGVTVYDFPFDTAAITDATVAGMHYRRYVYHRAFFPLTPATYTVPPGVLKYSLPEGDDYYSPVRPFTEQSTAATFVALPLPSSGRPMEFSGAVGELRDTIRTDGTQPRVGDGFMVTMRLSGAGNLKLLPRPALQVDWATIVPGGQRVAWDSSGTVVRGYTEFDWLVTPRVSGDLALPAIRYDYFNPTTRRYEVALTPLLRLTVLRASGAAPAIGKLRDTIGDSPFPVIVRFARSNGATVAIAAVAVLLVIAGIAMLARRRGGEHDDD